MTSNIEPVKDAFYVAIFLYEPGDGGLDRVAILLANGFAERGVKTELWLSKAEGPLATLISPAVQVRLVATPQIGPRGLRLFLQLPALSGMIRRLRPDVLLSAGNQSNLNLALAVIFARNGLSRAVQKITNPMLRPGMSQQQGWLRKIKFGLTAWLGAQTLTLSQADASELAQLFPRLRDRFQMVHNAYVTAAMLAIGQARPQLPAAAAPLLLSVGRLVQQKDHATLFAALALLKSRPWTLVILGDGPLKPALQQQAQQLGIAERIQFMGFVTDVLPWYAQAQLLVLSSRWEGLPAAPIEALACGCNVVTTDCSPGLRELMLAADLPAPVPVGDAPALALAIEILLARPRPSAAVSQIAARYSTAAAIDDHLRRLKSGPQT